MTNNQPRARLVALLLTLTGLLRVDGIAQARPSDKGVAAEADRYLAGLAREGRFSGAALVAREGRVLLSRGYGLADIEHGVPNTPRTKFRLASVTKPFTALAVMLLHERGRLSVEDPVCKYVAECPPSWQPVTLRHLLNHTSGLTEFGKPPAANDCFRRTPMTAAQSVERVRQFTPDFRPGEKFAYSSIAYVLLGHVVEQVSGRSYEAFLQENVFGPLGMKETGLARRRTIIPHLASGYARAPEGTLSNFDYFDTDYIFSAGGLYSTVGDLYLLDQALHGGRLLGAATLEGVFTPGFENFGLGWQIFRADGRLLVRADGRSFGFSGSVARYPAERVTVIVLTNIDTAGAHKLADELSAIVFGVKREGGAPKPS